ncbi:MAG: M23 family metallopeptidase [Verrucomicrobiota bacterium]
MALVLAVAGAATSLLLGTPSNTQAEAMPLFLADGFDFPVGKPDAAGYYRARGYYPNGHLGEDWNGRGGGNTDLGDPVYSIGRGVVVFSADYQQRWGNVVIIRHAYRESDGKIRYIDSLYGHLDERYVKLHDTVKRGELIGTIGNCRGIYLAHLHFEIRKNLRIGMKRSSYKGDYSNYHSPTKFIQDRRRLRTDFKRVPVPLNTFQTSEPAYPEIPKVTVPDTKPGSDPEQLKADVERVLEHYQPDDEKTANDLWQRLREKLQNAPNKEESPDESPPPDNPPPPES